MDGADRFTSRRMTNGGDQEFQRLIQGDPSGMGPLLEESRAALERHTATALKSSWLRFHYCARDIVQMTYTKVLRKYSTFQGETRPEWELWLRRISNRVFLDTVRDQKKLMGGVPGADGEVCSATMSEEAESTSSIWVKAAREETRRLLREALEKLPTRDRQIVLLRNFDDLSWDEVGVKVGCTADAARMRYHREIGPKLSRRLGSLYGIA